LSQLGTVLYNVYHNISLEKSVRISRILATTAALICYPSFSA